MKAVLFGDQERMRQLFANLMDNALKYTDPGGTIAVRWRATVNALPSISKIQLPAYRTASIDRLFERLYRVEASRSRAAGGAGLGLAHLPQYRGGPLRHY